MPSQQTALEATGDNHDPPPHSYRPTLSPQNDADYDLHYCRIIWRFDRSRQIGKTVVRRILMEEQSGFCAYCFNKMTMDLNRPNTCTREHVQARSDGGKSDRTNVIGCCSTCNGEKGDQKLVIFLLKRKMKSARLGL